MNFVRTEVAILIIFGLALVGQATAQNSANSNSSATKKPDDRAVQILNRPRVGFPSDCLSRDGTVRLKVIFDKSAKVTNAIVNSSSGCPSFDSAAVESARGIRFKPAIKNGEPATVALAVDYSFRR